ncbi:hypothetical protein D3C84_1204720 [compost metagenome]
MASADRCGGSVVFLHYSMAIVADRGTGHAAFSMDQARGYRPDVSESRRADKAFYGR